MSDSEERPGAEDTSPTQPPVPGSSGSAPPDRPEPTPEQRQNNQAAGPVNGQDTGEDLIAKLKQGLEKTRLPPELKAQILAELPPPEEQERMYRELQENGGLSFEELCASLGLDVEEKP